MKNPQRALEYRKFLQTPFWKALSDRKKKQAGHRCKDCGSTHKLECHHLRYPADWFDTNLADLEVLCRTCHKKRHVSSILWKPFRKKKRRRLSGKEKMKLRAREFNTWTRYHQ